MWSYEKRLQYPVNITTPNAKLAEVIISQYGGPDGEMGASMRYLSQRYGVPYPEIAAVLTDIGISVPKLRITILWFLNNLHRENICVVILIPAAGTDI